VEQAQRWVKFCRKLLQLPKDHRFIKRIVTCNEKWIYLNNLDIQKQWLDKGQLPVPARFEKRSSSASGGTTKVLFIMNLCQMAVRSMWSIFSTIRENVYGFALKVPSTSEPKARYFSKITLVHTWQRKLFRKLKNWKVLNCYHIPLLVLILSHQTTVSFYGPAPSW
jgi:hypothetical protein